MLKREITYEDFDGDKVTETFYFNISKPEVYELEVEFKDGLAEYLTKIVKLNDRKQIIEFFKKFILTAYGEKSEDGKKFVKTKELSDGFAQTQAYESLFMELATVEDTAIAFISGVLPKDMNVDQDKPEGPPKPPVPPIN